jgi:integrase
VERFRSVAKAANQAVRRHNNRLRQRSNGRQFFVPSLRLILALAFHTGQRIDAILHLKADDVRITRHGMRDAIREAIRTISAEEKPSEAWADDWPDGLLYFRRSWSKTKYDRPIPVNPVLRGEIDIYLKLREAAGIDSPWLFPSPNDPARPLRYDDALTLLDVAEEVARQMVEQAGLDPDDVVPDLGDQKWHGYRALWENLRDDLGWGLNKNAAYAGGWTTAIGGPQDSAYRRLKPHFIFAVVCGRSVLEILEDAGETERAREAIQTPIPCEETEATASSAAA